MDIIHTSVLKKEVLQYLKPDAPGAFHIDGTLGEGGHAELFLSSFPDLTMAGLDADAGIQARARERLAAFGDRIRFYNVWFDSFFRNYPEELPRPTSILLDLGISSFHYESSGRGFSFQKDEPLDMRLSDTLEVSAADIVNDYPEDELADLLYMYGDERFSRKIAWRIAEARAKERIRTAQELAEIVKQAMPSKFRYGRIHPATKTFQALRIAVNGELERLKSVLVSSLRVLQPGGKMGIITFHSLEDRIVKHFFRDRNKACICPPEAPMCICGGKPLLEILTKKPVSPDDEEIRENPASRSSHLRVVRKLRDEGDSE